MLTVPSSPWPETDVEDRGLATAELSLGGMYYSACATRIEGALAEHEGVISASVNLATTRAFVAYDPAAVGIEELCGAVDGAGYNSAPVEADQGAAVGERSDHWGMGRSSRARWRWSPSSSRWPRPSAWRGRPWRSSCRTSAGPWGTTSRRSPWPPWDCSTPSWPPSPWACRA